MRAFPSLLVIRDNCEVQLLPTWDLPLKAGLGPQQKELGEELGHTPLFLTCEVCASWSPPPLGLTPVNSTSWLDPFGNAPH